MHEGFIHKSVLVLVPRISTVNMTLPGRSIADNPVRGASSYWSISAARVQAAVNQLHVAVAIDRQDRQTDRRTSGRTSYRYIDAHHYNWSGSVMLRYNLQNLSNREIVFWYQHSGLVQGWKNLGLKKVFRFLGFLGFCMKTEHESTTQKHMKNIPYARYAVSY